MSRVGSGLTRKDYTKMESLPKDKHSILQQTFVKYGRKKFYDLDTGIAAALDWSAFAVKPVAPSHLAKMLPDPPLAAE